MSAGGQEEHEGELTAAFGDSQEQTGRNEAAKGVDGAHARHDDTPALRKDVDGQRGEEAREERPEGETHNRAEAEPARRAAELLHDKVGGDCEGTGGGSAPVELEEGRIVEPSEDRRRWWTYLHKDSTDGALRIAGLAIRKRRSRRIRTVTKKHERAVCGRGGVSEGVARQPRTTDSRCTADC